MPFLIVPILINTTEINWQLTSSNLSLVGRRFGCLVRATLTKLWKFCVL